jgi:hypothetical protein
MSNVCSQTPVARRAASGLAAYGCALVVVCLCACTGGTPVRSSPGPVRLEAFDRANYRWVSAQCVDGVLDLARQGFERTLSTERLGSRLRFTYETRLAQPQCVSTEVWSLSPDAGAGQWQFVADADVRLPVETPCGAALPTGVEHGVVQVTGDTLEELRFNSSWCRGFDVRFVYRRTPDRPLGQAELIRRYVAHWNRRDARAIAALFAHNGTLSEPFSRSSDGQPIRHEGRVQIEAWLRSAFDSVPWLALQLSDIETLDEQGQSLALWRYFDPKLAEPVQGRNLFVLAGGEIFATELQLVSEPVPVAAMPQN